MGYVTNHIHNIYTNLTAYKSKAEYPWNNVKDSEYRYKEDEKDFINPIVVALVKNKDAVKKGDKEKKGKKGKKKKTKSKFTKIGKQSRVGRIDPVETVRVMVILFISQRPLCH